MVESGQCVGDNLERFAAFAYTYDVTGLYCIRRNVYHAAVYGDVTVENQLTGCRTGGCDAQTVYYVVETAFEKLQKDSPVIPFRLDAFLNRLRN